jgi:predicted transcriptional regulator of viral defense system
MESEPGWDYLVKFQSGITTRNQAIGAGLAEKTIDRCLRHGAWQRLQRGAYATFTGGPSREARLWAALLRAGPGAVLSHETAAELHGLTSTPSTKIHITVPHEHNPARGRKIPGVIIHRSRRIAADPQPPWQLPRTHVADTVLDLISAARTFDDAYGWISRGVGTPTHRTSPAPRSARRPQENTLARLAH